MMTSSFSALATSRGRPGSTSKRTALTALYVHGTSVTSTRRSSKGFQSPFETLEETNPPERFAMYVAIGFSQVNKARAEVYEQCKRRGYELISYEPRRPSIGANRLR
jgi:hypothetical protein